MVGREQVEVESVVLSMQVQMKTDRRTVAVVIAVALSLGFMGLGSAADESQPAARSEGAQGADTITIEIYPGNELKVPPGSMFTERMAFARKLQAAAKKGVGIEPYLAAFIQLQESMAQNGDAQNLRSRLEQFDRDLQAQLNTSSMLKKFHPTPAPSFQNRPGINAPNSINAGASSAAALFAEKCSRCHSLDGSKKRDLGNVSNWNSAELSEKVAKMQSKKGVGTLDPTEISALVRFLQHR